MKIVKKIDLYLLKNFLVLFLATFFICIFILLMQFLWMHVKDLVGKGVEISVLAEFFVYAVMSVVPLALPLAILLASLISFGNLGEKFELTAMKAAGISLFRILRPLFVAIVCISVGAFYFSDHILPRSQMKLWTLIFSLRQKTPELDIPEGEFYSGIDGYNVYVRHKNVRTGMLYDVVIYDVSKGFSSATVMLADSANMFFSGDKKYLLLRLYDGESFENLNQSQQRAMRSEQNIPYRRETFSSRQILIDFSTEFERYDESILQDQHVSKNARQLIQSIDSVQVLAHQRSTQQSQDMVERQYFGRERKSQRQLIPADAEDWKDCDVDSIFATFTAYNRQCVMNLAVDKAIQKRDMVQYNFLMLNDYQAYIRKHEIELYRKFTLAFACLIFFFIGAPLGAIIRKGGLGAPVVISVVMFIIYYIIDNTGYKMAREALWPCWAGMCLSSFVLLPIGIFLTYKAATDAALLNPEAWIKVWEKIKAFILKTKEICYLRLKKH